MSSERTAWAEGMGLAPAAVDFLTEIAEEAAERGPPRWEGDRCRWVGRELDLPANDVWSSWPPALREAGHDDLADRVEELERELERE